MAIAPVRKLHVIAHRRQQAELMAVLQKTGAAEIRSSSIAAGEAEPRPDEQRLDSRLRRIDEALRVLKPFFPAETMAEKLYPVRPKYSERALQRLESDFDLEAFLSECEERGSELEQLQTGLSRLEEERRGLMPWISLDAPPSALRSTARLDVSAGRLPVTHKAAFTRELEKIGSAFVAVREDARHLYGVALCLRACGPRIAAAASEHGFEQVKLPDIDELPAARISAIEAERKRISDRVGEVRESYRELASRRAELRAMRDVTAVRLGRLQAERLVGHTRATFSLEGWVPAAKIEGLRRRLAAKFPLAVVEDYEPGAHEKVPVILETPPLVRPFGLVLDLYGLPRYGTVDPSAVMAAFFALFFGLCLTDAGYGILLAAVTGLVLLRAPRPLPPSRKRFLQMFFLCGIATTAAGAAAGGWFGVSVPWRLFDPLEDLMLFAFLALSVGTLHLFAGLALRIAGLARQGKVFEALVDHGIWMVLVVALFGLAASSSGAAPPWAAGAARTGAVLSAVVIVFFQGRNEEEGGAVTARRLIWGAAALLMAAWLLGALRPWSGIAALLVLSALPLLLKFPVRRVLLQMGLGLYALYGVTGYLSDILSYSRLVALGLGTGIVALVVNKMAGVALGAPGVGVVAAGAVLVVGHLFNVLINLLGAFVHSCRLQYVEFFTKFYESGGKPLVPFRFETKYITIDEQA